MRSLAESILVRCSFAGVEIYIRVSCYVENVNQDITSSKDRCTPFDLNRNLSFEESHFYYVSRWNICINGNVSACSYPLVIEYPLVNEYPAVNSNEVDAEANTPPASIELYSYCGIMYSINCVTVYCI